MSLGVAMKFVVSMRISSRAIFNVCDVDVRIVNVPQILAIVVVIRNDFFEKKIFSLITHVVDYTMRSGQTTNNNNPR